MSRSYVKPTAWVPPLEAEEQTVLFETSWERDGTGSSWQAFSDNYYWDDYHPNTQGGLVVIDSSAGESIPGGHNALRVEQDGIAPEHKGSEMVWKGRYWENADESQYDGRYDLPRDYAWRFYMKNRDWCSYSPTGGGWDHIFQTHPLQVWYGTTWAMGKHGSGSSGDLTWGWRFYNNLFPPAISPWYTWNGSTDRVLSGDTWYRFEFLFKFYTLGTGSGDPGDMRIYPRIYNLAGTLLYDYSNFRSSDYNDYLSKWYDTAGEYLPYWDGTLDTFWPGGRYGVLNCIDIGNNGQVGAVDTDEYWFHSSMKCIDASSLEYNSETWVGPI